MIFAKLKINLQITPPPHLLIYVNTKNKAICTAAQLLL